MEKYKTKGIRYVEVAKDISAFVMPLADGGRNFYDGWMKKTRSAMIFCNDDFRPVSVYIKALDEEADV